MIYLFGNCQTEFLFNALAARNLDACSRQLASPMTCHCSPGEFDHELARQVSRHGVEDYFHGRSLFNQQVLLGPDDPPADLVVFSMFHEPGPLFLNERGQSFFIDPLVISQHPAFGEFLTRNFRAVQPDPMSYLQRFGSMVERFRKHHPETPLLILSRLSHYPGFGPDPFSYLDGWGESCFQAMPALEDWVSSLDGCQLLNMDRLFARIWRDSPGTRIEAHCPFLKFESEDDGSTVRIRRDLEHVGSMWTCLAEVIDNLVNHSMQISTAEADIPESWHVEHEPECLGTAQIAQALNSGSNYRFARGMSSMFGHEDEDLTPLLARSAVFAPICHNSLHMVRAYGRSHPTRAYLVFLLEHNRKAQSFTANGKAYQHRYLARLAEMVAEARSLLS